MMHPIRPAQSDELRAALGVLLSRPGTTSGELNSQIDALLRYVSKQHLSLEHCLIAGRPGQIETACLCVDGPGRTSSVFIPNSISSPAHAETVVALLTQSVAEAQRRCVRLLQGLVAPEASEQGELFAEAGFTRLTDLIYLEREAVAPLPRHRPICSLTWTQYAAGEHQEFARVIEGTYAGSLDCAALSGVRQIEDTLASHRAAGEFDPRLWLVARTEAEAIGVLLMARIPERASVEVVYMGVLPQARGRGFGAAMLSRAIETARLHGAALVTLTVDVENSPARKLYSSFGFNELSRREVWMRILPE